MYNCLKVLLIQYKANLFSIAEVKFVKYFLLLRITLNNHILYHNLPYKLWYVYYAIVYHIPYTSKHSRGKLSWILAKRESFTIESFPSSQLENNYS